MGEAGQGGGEGLQVVPKGSEWCPKEHKGGPKGLGLAQGHAGTGDQPVCTGDGDATGSHTDRQHRSQSIPTRGSR